MKKLFKVLYWVVSVLVVLFLIGLGLRVARALLGVAVIVGLAVIAYAIFARPRAGGSG